MRVYFGRLQLGAAVSLVGVVWLGSFILSSDEPVGPSGATLMVHCAAGIKAPVSAVAQRYEAEYGTSVRLSFAGSGALLSGLVVRQTGDLYLAGDDSYLELARRRGLVEEVFGIASMRPVIAVQPGNPKQIAGLRDLLGGGVRYGLGNPEAAAVGKIVKQTALRLGIWQQLEPGAVVFKPTVNDLANDLRLGTVDAVVIWDATARQHGLAIVADVDLAKSPRQVTLGVLAASAQPSTALHFARYLTARDRGLPEFASAGFTPIQGDAWADVPHLSLMAGAMLRPAIDQTIREFEAREGVVVERVYNGCGILVAQIRAGSLPDAYFACDQSFLDSVAAQFDPGLTFSKNDIVLVTQKGNPRQLRQLADLSSAGLRLGVGHPQKSALGVLTASLLQRHGVAAPLQRSGNIAVESPTGDMLVNQLRAGALDAILVYRSNAAMVAEHLEILQVERASATQPLALARLSAHKQLLRRLQDRLRSAASAARFEALGFLWQGDREPR